MSLSGCDGGSNNNAIPTHNTGIDVVSSAVVTNNSLYSLGGTYDTMSNHATNTETCLNAASNESNFMIRNPHATLDFTQNQSLQQVMSALGVDFSMHISLGVSSVNVAYHYAKTSQNNAYTLNLNYIYDYSGTKVFKDGAIHDGESALTLLAKSQVNHSPEEFRKICGDEFVNELNAGASVLMRLSLRFDSAVEKNYFTENMDKVGGLQNILDTIRSNPRSIRYTLTASGLQVGGNPDGLNNLFIKNGGKVNADGYAELQCGSSSSISPLCVNLVNSVIDYAVDLKSQLNDPKDYYLTNPVLAKWSSIGIFPGDVNLDPNILNAMQGLNKLYLQDSNDYDFMNNYSQMLSNKGVLSSEMSQKLLLLQNKYKQLMNLYDDPSYHLADCFNGFVSTNCINIHDNFVAARERILNNPEQMQFLSYLKQNQYNVELFTRPDVNATSICEILPISSSNDSGQFMINCDGQVSTGASNTPIIIKRINGQKNISISNFVYKYQPFGSSVITDFKYEFNQSLDMDSFYENMYAGDARVTIHNSTIDKQFNQNFFLTNFNEGMSNE